MDREILQAFKKYKHIGFLLSDKSLVFYWGEGSEKGIPHDRIYIGRRGATRPDLVLSPYDIEKVAYTKPGLFSKGTLTVVGVGGKAIRSFPFKDKSNMKEAEKFNECLRLYKKYELGK